MKHARIVRLKRVSCIAISPAGRHLGSFERVNNTRANVLLLIVIKSIILNKSINFTTALNAAYRPG